MRLRPARAICALVLIQAIGCGSDDNPIIPEPTPAPVWSEITNLVPSTTLYGMWAPRQDLVIAVGRGGTIWQWDGIMWTQRISPTPQDLFSIAGSVTGGVVAVGANGTLVEQVQGSFVLRSSPTQQYLHSVWRTSTGQFVAVGDNGVIVRGAGTAWSMETSRTYSPLLSVWGAADNNIFAVGADGTIIRYEGVQWIPMQSGTSEILVSVSGTSANDVYAASAAGSIFHYDGGVWTRVTTPPTGLLQSVCADCGPVAVGANGDVMRKIDGTWQLEVMSGEPWLYATAKAGTDVWAIGANALFRHDGVSWTSEARGTIPVLRGGTSTQDGQLMLVGDGGATMRGDAEGWQYEDAGALSRLNCAWTTPTGEILAGGINRIFRWTISGWVVENQEVAEHFDIEGNNTFTFAVGSDGVIRRRNGTSWGSFQRLTAGGSNVLHAVDMSGEINYAAGENYIYRLQGADGATPFFDLSHSRPGTVFWDVRAIDSENWQALAVGSNGVCVGRSAGVVPTWTTIPTNVTTTLHALAMGPGHDVYAVGAGGTVLRFVDDQWTEVTSPTSRTLLKAWSRGGALFACGGNPTSGGILFRYGPPNP